VGAFEKDMLEYFNSTAQAVRNEIEQKQALDEELEQKLRSAISDFQAGWQAPGS